MEPTAAVETLKETTSLIEYLIKYDPAAGALAVLVLIILLYNIIMGFQRSKSQAIRDQLLIDVIRSNATAMESIKGAVDACTTAVNRLMDLCHFKIGDGGDGG